MMPGTLRRHRGAEAGTPRTAQGAGTNELYLPPQQAASVPAPDVLVKLGSSEQGLTEAEARRRGAETGPNAVRTHKARAGVVLLRQLRSPLLILLAVTALISFFLGDAPNAVTIGIILALSVGLGFLNEFRAEQAAEALHSNVARTASTLRDGVPRQVDVVDLVPGDVVHLALGMVIPADLRLLTVTDLQCSESILTGEPVPVDKRTTPVEGSPALADLACCAFMGTVVSAGAGMGVVTATGANTEFGRIALGLGESQPETEFQLGLRRFSGLLLKVAGSLTGLIFVINLVLQRPFIDSLLFSLAIAVGITPQLLPAVVSTSLATGSRDLARHRVLVKRLVCIEDLGDMDLLVTDKTGTLTEGSVGFAGTYPADGGLSARELLTLGVLSTEAEYGGPGEVFAQNQLDSALWNAAGANHPSGYKRLDLLPFDHNRRLTSVLLRDGKGVRSIITKGAPENVLERCTEIPSGAAAQLQDLFASGGRVVAVATRAAEDHADSLAPTDEQGLSLRGFLVFEDPPKADAAASLHQLTDLGIAVKVATGDNPMVAEKVFDDLGLARSVTLTGPEIERMGDDELNAAAEGATIFARVTPEQKARIIRVLRGHGHAVGFLGDGVNDALALHSADVGISVDQATDVAKDAADVVLLEKDLGVLAEGVREGRRIFSNTIKYVMMGTSSNFGNMFSAALGSAVLPFLPMLPRQILLNNLLYDSSQLAIPTDNVDADQLRAPSHWNLATIRRFMLLFGPISSLFDFATFGLMLWVFSASAGEFRSGWFIESLATQTLIIFAIRTRRVPFFRSRPSMPLTLAALAVVAVGMYLPYSPVAAVLGFSFLPDSFFLALLAMVLLYLVVVEGAKKYFYARLAPAGPAAVQRGRHHHVHRRAAPFSIPGPVWRPSSARPPANGRPSSGARPSAEARRSAERAHRP